MKRLLAAAFLALIVAVLWFGLPNDRASSQYQEHAGIDLSIKDSASLTAETAPEKALTSVEENMAVDIGNPPATLTASKVQRLLNGIYISDGREYDRVDMAAFTANPGEVISWLLAKQLENAGFNGDVALEIKAVSVSDDGATTVRYTQLFDDIPLSYSPKIVVNSNGVIVKHNAVVFEPSLVEGYSVTPEEARYLAIEKLAELKGINSNLIQLGTVSAGSIVTDQGSIARNYDMTGVENVGVKAEPVYSVTLFAAQPQSIFGTYRLRVSGSTGDASMLTRPLEL